jgi:hypothetical protein
MFKFLKPGLIVISMLILGFSSCTKDNDPPPPPDVDAPDIDNKVPLAHAGLHHELKLPIDTVYLIGSGTDSDGVISAYLWSQVSGPADTRIQNPGAATTQVQFNQSGLYHFQLMVVDNSGATGIDTVSVRVYPNPGADTLSLQPSHNDKEVHIWGNPNLDESWPGSPEISADAWTSNGENVFVRAAFAFDLSSIPKTATIVSATLSLYSSHTPSNGNLVDANFGADNTMLLQEINQSWVAANVHWNSQPSTTVTNQVLIPSTNLSFLDLSIDVKANIIDMVQNNNYGFLIKLQNEVNYTSRIFCSSYYPDATKHPKLVVIYKTN